MNNFQKVFRNTFYLFLSEVLLKILGFIWIIFLARNLSVELFGRYNLVNAFIAIFSFLPDMGIGLITIREIAKHREKAAFYLGYSFILNTVLGAITISIILLFSNILGYDGFTQNLILIATLTLFLSTIRSVGIFYFDGMEKMKISAFLNSLNTIFLISGGFLLYYYGFGVEGIFYGMLLGTILSLFITWRMTFRYIIPKLILNFSQIKHIFLEGLPLGLAAFSALVYTRIDSIILAHYLGDRLVGIYNSATPFVLGLIQMLNVPFMVAVYPALSRLSSMHTDRFISATKKSLGIIAMWSISAAVLISTLSGIIPVIFGEKYEDAIPVLRVLIFFVPFASLCALLYKVLIILGKQKIYLLVSICGAILNISLNIFLIPRMEIMGAAIASVTTQAALFIAYVTIVFYLFKKLKT